MTKIRDYDAANALEKYKNMSAFNVTEAVSKKRVNQHLVIYTMPDGSKLYIYPTAGRMDASHPAWRGTKDDIHLGPIQGTPCRINCIGQ